MPEWIENRLQELLGLETGQVDSALLKNTLFKPVSDLLSRRGKNFRSQLVNLGFELCENRNPSAPEQTVLDTCGRVLELLHAGSLAIDDIEDGSLKRRGEPTLHIKYGVPLAINVGNWLYFYPLELVRALGLPPEQELRIFQTYHRALLRAHMGQALDLGVPIDDLPREQVYETCLSSLELKTGSLTALALGLGATSANSPEKSQSTLESFGRKFGIALQMFDDLGNARGARDPEKRWEDLRNRRPTWLWASIARYGTQSDFDTFVSAVRKLPNDSALESWFSSRTEFLRESKRRAELFLKEANKDLARDTQFGSSSAFGKLETLETTLVAAYD